MRYVLTIFAALVLAAPAHSRYWQEPPRRYRDAGREMDRQGLIDWRVNTGGMDWLCQVRDWGGCAIMWPDGACTVYLAPDAWNDRVARDHEGAHCAGWRH